MPHTHQHGMDSYRSQNEALCGLPNMAKNAFESTEKKEWLGFGGCLWDGVRAPAYGPKLPLFELHADAKGGEPGLSYHASQMWGKRERRMMRIKSCR